MESEPAQTAKVKSSSQFIGLLFSLFKAFVLMVALATILAGCARYHWLADLFAHLRVQYFLALIPAGIVLLFCRKKFWLVVCLICLLINGVPLSPYFFKSADQVEWADSTRRQTKRLLCQNVLTTNQQWESVSRLINEELPDFVVLMETNSTWELKLESLLETYPNYEFVPSPGNFGIAVLAKQPWRSLEVVRIPPLELPSLIVEFELQTGEDPTTILQIVATHPIPPMGAEQTRHRDEQLRQMANRVRQDCPAIMAGDLNLTPWSPRFGEVLKTGRLKDSAYGFGWAPTWYAFPGFLGGIRIDHILVNDLIHPVEYKVLPDVGSDHRGVLLEFSLGFPMTNGDPNRQ